MPPNDLVIFDFDGPICDLFAGRSARTVAENVVATVAPRLGAPSSDLESGDPLVVLHKVSSITSDLAVRLEADRALTAEELLAVDSARPTSGALTLLRSLGEAGFSVAIASNNSPECIHQFLRQHSTSVEFVVGRIPAHPELMKPDPSSLIACLEHFGPGTSCLGFVGDSIGDVQAAKAAGIRPIGWANKPGKAEALHEAGASSIVTRVDQLRTLLVA